MSDIAVDQTPADLPDGGTCLRRRRWPWLILAVVAVLAAVAATITFVWFPRYRPSLRQGERYGVDVSHHQGSIDWARVAADDMSFAYVKATEGGDHVDRRFLEKLGRCGGRRSRAGRISLLHPVHARPGPSRALP